MLCIPYIPILSKVSLPKNHTHFSRMKSKTNILSPWVTLVGGEYFFVTLES